MSLKEEIKEILIEHVSDMGFTNSFTTIPINEEIDKVVELVMEVINDNPLMEPLK